MATDYQDLLGQRLRAIRQQQGLTLQEVEKSSGGRWKAVVIGAYERGERAISAAKLADLARFYGVPVAELLPERDADRPRGGVGDVHTVVLDLTQLGDATMNPALKPISRLATTIQRQRGDYNGRVLTLRRDDLRVLAVVFGLTPDELVTRLDGEGVLRTS